MHLTLMEWAMGMVLLALVMCVVPWLIVKVVCGMGLFVGLVILSVAGRGE